MGSDINKQVILGLTIPCLWGIALSVCAQETVGADDPFWRALTGGKVDFSMRYRYETVDDDLAPGGVPLKDAHASTLRTTLGYRTGTLHDVEAYLQLENVTEVGADDYNDGSNGKTRFATVVDPTGTEVKQSYLGFSGLSDTRIRAGRQIVTYREAPFHRFIGTVLWRQNWQTFDALSVENKSLPNTTFNYAYIWNVNRIFGEDAPSPLDNFDSNSHLINVQYDGLSCGKLEAYSYLLDFDNAAAFSTKTFGVRFSGKQSLTSNVAALYTGEYANQTDHANQPADIDADYFLGELGANIKIGNLIDSVTFKGSYELLGGDGGADRFVTILGTNHAFQGWADRFLVTPGDGIEDIIATFIAKGMGAQFIAAYHMLSSDRDSYDYGDELDLLLTKTFGGHYTLGLKYSDYDADRNVTNVARNVAQSADVSKFWAFAQIAF